MSYKPSPKEYWMIACLRETIRMIESGEAHGVGLCSIDAKKEVGFTFIENVDQPVLRHPLSQLLGVYEVRHRKLVKEVNAPRTNYSYGTH